MTPLYQIRGLGRSFGPVRVLDGVSLDLRAGEVVGLLGENGAGKSTLMNILSGNLQPDAGTLRFEGEAVRWTGPRAALDRGIAFVHQELTAIRGLSVKENIFLGEYRSRRGVVRGAVMRRDAAALLARVGAGHIDPDAVMGSLRLADQQAVEIAKAVGGRLKLLFMDEPTSSLTQHEAASLFRLIRQLRGEGVSIVFVSHRLEEALGLCDRIVTLRDGRLVSDRPTAEVTRAGILVDMAGRAVDDSARPVPAPGPASPVRLAVRGLSDGRLVRDVSFDLRAGEVLGVFGLVGAGRTELLEMLYGARAPASGSVALDGREVRFRRPSEAMRAGLALVPEGRKASGILPWRPVRENVSISSLGALSRGPALDVGAERTLVGDMVRSLGIRAGSLDQPIRFLSGGNQQKAILARCLATRPRVLLLDEPTHGVDVRTKAQIYEIIRDLASSGVAVLMVSSELPEILGLATRVLVLSGGRAAGLLDNQALSSVEIMERAFRHVA